MLYDKKKIVALILMPIILITILSFALVGSFQEMGSQWTLNIAIVTAYDREADIERFERFMKTLGSSVTEEINMDTAAMIEQFDPEKIFFDEFLGSDGMVDFFNYQVVSMDEAMSMLSNKQVNSVIIMPASYVYNALVNTFTPFRNNTTFTVMAHPDLNYSRLITEEVVQGFGEAKGVYLVRG